MNEPQPEHCRCPWICCGALYQHTLQITTTSTPAAHESPCHCGRGLASDYFVLRTSSVSLCLNPLMLKLKMRYLNWVVMLKEEGCWSRRVWNPSAIWAAGINPAMWITSLAFSSFSTQTEHQPLQHVIKREREREAVGGRGGEREKRSM